MTKRQQAREELNQLVDMGYDPERILGFIMDNHLSGSEALEAIKAFRKDEEIDEPADHEGEIEDPFANGEWDGDDDF